jgi:hypothetical protein
VSNWPDDGYKRRLRERDEVFSRLRLTLYGSFQPQKEKEKLESLASELRHRGFLDTGIVGDSRRPNREMLDTYQLSIFYLEESDANFLIFPQTGKRLGVTAELAHILESLEMSRKRSTCVIFDQLKGKHGSLTQLQLDRIAELGDIELVPFSDWNKLPNFCFNRAVEMCRRLWVLLRSRVPS